MLYANEIFCSVFIPVSILGNEEREDVGRLLLSQHFMKNCMLYKYKCIYRKMAVAFQLSRDLSRYSYSPCKHRWINIHIHNVHRLKRYVEGVVSGIDTEHCRIFCLCFLC